MSETETAFERQGRVLHDRAEAILRPLLANQGRDPHAYTQDEYVVAYGTAEAELGTVTNDKGTFAEQAQGEHEHSAVALNQDRAILDVLKEMGFAAPVQGNGNFLYNRAREILTEQGIDRFDQNDLQAAMKVAISELKPEQIAELATEMNLAPATASDAVSFEEMLSEAVDRGAILASGKGTWRAIYAADTVRAMRMLTVLTAATSNDSSVLPTKELRAAAARATTEIDGVKYAPDREGVLLGEETNRQLRNMGFEVGEDGELPENVTAEAYKTAVTAAKGELKVTDRFDSPERKVMSNPIDSRGENRSQG